MVHGEAYLLHVAAPVGPGEQLLGLAARQGQLRQLKKVILLKQTAKYILFILVILNLYLQIPPGSRRVGSLTKAEISRTHPKSSTLQRKSHLWIPFFLGIALPRSQFPHSCVCEIFIYSQDRSTDFLQQNRQIDCGNL
jgi:hypothetical protein